MTQQLVKTNDQRRFDALDMIIMACLTLSAMNFSQKYFYFFFAAFFMQVWKWRGRLSISHSAMLYIVFSCVRGISELVYSGGGALTFLRQVAFCCAYLFGLNIGYGEGEEVEKAYIRYMIIFTTGLLIHYVLNWGYNFSSTIGRNTIDIWSGSVLSATGQAMISCIPLGVCASMLLNGFSQRQKIMSAVGLVCIMGYNMMLSGRTVIVLFVVLLAINWGWSMRDPHQKEQGGFLRKYAVLIIGAIAAIYFMVQNQQEIMESNLFMRLSAMDDLFGDERGIAKVAYLQNMLRYPLGGYHLREELGYAHDLVMDTYAESGVISLFLLLGILGTSAYDVYFMMRNSLFTRKFRIIVLSVFVSIWTFFAMEPVLVGAAWLFAIYAFLCGGLHAIIRDRVRRSYSEGFTD